MALPVFDKVYRKTLCLQDYKLSDGHVRGIASACPLFDHSVVNRFLFSNCGLSGDQFAIVLQGAKNMKDFKSVIYKRDSININSIMSLKPLFARRIPYHMEELKLIDCKISSSDLEILLDCLLEDSKIKTLSLVNLPQTEVTIEKIGELVEKSETLVDLDLSWSNVRPSVMQEFLKIIKHNKTL